MLIDNRSSFVNHTYSGPKWAKSMRIFRPKRRKNPTLWGGTYLYGFYKGVLPRTLISHYRRKSTLFNRDRGYMFDYST